MNDRGLVVDCGDCDRQLNTAEIVRHYPVCPDCGGKVRVGVDRGEDDRQAREHDGASTAGTLSGEHEALLLSVVEGLGDRVYELYQNQAPRVAPNADDDVDGPSDFTVYCPNCDRVDEVVLAIEAAEVLDREGHLTAEFLDRLAAETHACQRCNVAFTP